MSQTSFTIQTTSSPTTQCTLTRQDKVNYNFNQKKMCTFLTRHNVPRVTQGLFITFPYHMANVTSVIGQESMQHLSRKLQQLIAAPVNTVLCSAASPSLQETKARMHEKCENI